MVMVTLPLLLVNFKPYAVPVDTSDKYERINQVEPTSINTIYPSGGWYKFVPFGMVKGLDESLSLSHICLVTVYNYHRYVHYK